MNIFRLSIISLIFLAIFAYFSYHTIYGNRGLISKVKVQKEVQAESNKLETVRQKKLEVEQQVKLLRSDSLDKDMLEEQARKVLGVAKENEEVIIRENNK